MTKSFYISTPIYYPSAKPHMGHAYSSIIADIFARFKRLEGYKVLFLTDCYFKSIKEKKNSKIESIIEKKSFILSNINKFVTYNLNQNSLINAINNKLFNG